MNSKLLIISVIFFNIACSGNNENDEDSIQECSDPRFILELTENIPATVSIVEEGEPFFNGIKTYYEVDAETYIPELFEQNGQKIIRIFPTSKIDKREGDKVNIKGKLSTCFPADHGLLINIYHGFIILEQQ